MKKLMDLILVRCLIDNCLNVEFVETFRPESC